MGIDARHPEYDEYVDIWRLMRDSYNGERAIKLGLDKYLPMSQSHAEDLTGLSYKNYVARAVYHDFVNAAVKAAIGIMHRKPPIINLPPRMEQLRNNATPLGESLNSLLRRINTEQLISGRCGIMTDILSSPNDSNPMPYIVTYNAEKIINWDVGTADDSEKPKLRFIVLNETEAELKDDFSWQEIEKYRVLYLGDLDTRSQDGVYRQYIYKKNGENKKELENIGFVAPILTGKTLNEIPFAIANAGDASYNIDNPPLLGLAKLCLAIYRTEAIYRQALFFTAESTLVIIGGSADDTKHIGGGHVIDIKSTGGDAKFIGASGNGLPELRIAIQYDVSRAMLAAGQLLTSNASDDSSGEALKIRVAAQTATLVHVAQSGAFALESILKTIGRWMNLPDEDIEKIEIIPNVDFIDDVMSGDELLKIMNAKALGLPVSLESIHSLISRKGITDLTFEDEQDKIEGEINASGGLEYLNKLNIKDIVSSDNNQSVDSSSKDSVDEKVL